MPDGDASGSGRDDRAIYRIQLVGVIAFIAIGVGGSVLYNTNVISWEVLFTAGLGISAIVVLGGAVLVGRIEERSARSVLRDANKSVWADMKRTLARWTARLRRR